MRFAGRGVGRWWRNAAGARSQYRFIFVDKSKDAKSRLAAPGRVKIRKVITLETRCYSLNCSGFGIIEDRPFLRGHHSIACHPEGSLSSRDARLKQVNELYIPRRTRMAGVRGAAERERDARAYIFSIGLKDCVKEYCQVWRDLALRSSQYTGPSTGVLRLARDCSSSG
jgi:hypothetical protein